MDASLTLKLLSATTYAAYSVALETHSISRHSWFKTFIPGQLVMEISTIHHRDRDQFRFGYLISEGRVPLYTEEEWEQIDDKCEGEQRPTEKGYKIKLLTTGQEYTWTNAMFIRVPEETLTF